MEEKQKQSDLEEEMEDSEFDTSMAEDDNQSGKESTLRKRVTFDVSEESESEARKKQGGAAEDAAKESSMGKVLILLTLVFVALSSFGFYFSNNQADDHDAEWVVEQLGKNMKLVRSKFASQAQYIWSDLYSGIEKVLLENPTEPHVFLLVHQGPDTTSSCLARKIGGLAHALVNASTPHVLTVAGTTLSKNKEFAANNKLFAETYRPLVEQHRVMILNDLQLVPAKTAKGLNVFCNTAAPFVDKALYLITLKVSKSNDKESAKTIAERELYTAWNEVSKADLKPSVSCLTGGSILWIEAEKKEIDGC